MKAAGMPSLNASNPKSRRPNLAVPRSAAPGRSRGPCRPRLVQARRKLGQRLVRRSRRCGRPGEHGDRTSPDALNAHLADELPQDADAHGPHHVRRGRRVRKRRPVERSRPRAVLPAGHLALIVVNPTPGGFSNRGLNSHQTPVRFRRTYLLARGAGAGRGGEGTWGTGVHDRSETVRRGSLATSPTCRGWSRRCPGPRFSLRSPRLLRRVRVPQAGDLVECIGPRPFTGELSRGSFCAPAEHGP
jgi:hypothetical protein